MKKGAIRQQQIIETAEKLFYQNGYEETSIQDILDEEFTDVPPEGIAPPGEDFECQVLYRKSKYA